MNFLYECYILRGPLRFKSNIQNIYYLREETFVNMYNLFLKYICLISESWILVWVVGLWASSVCLDRPKSLLEHGMGGRNEISLGEFKFWYGGDGVLASTYRSRPIG